MGMPEKKEGDVFFTDRYWDRRVRRARRQWRHAATHRWLKREAHRWMRHQWKRLGEDAPRKYYFSGWEW